MSSDIHHSNPPASKLSLVPDFNLITHRPGSCNKSPEMCSRVILTFTSIESQIHMYVRVVMVYFCIKLIAQGVNDDDKNVIQELQRNLIIHQYASIVKLGNDKNQTNDLISEMYRRIQYKRITYVFYLLYSVHTKRLENHKRNQHCLVYALKFHLQRLRVGG